MPGLTERVMILYTPNMITEVVDAVDYYFAEEPDIAADCYLFLRGLGSSMELLNTVKKRATSELIKRDRCDKCGEKLKLFQYGEVHRELEEEPVERMYVKLCPNCDIADRDLKPLDDDWPIP